MSKVGNGNVNRMLQAPFSLRAHFCASKGPYSCGNESIPSVTPRDCAGGVF